MFQIVKIMQSYERRMKRGTLGARHKTTKNRKGQQYRMQLITMSNVAFDANQKINKTLIHYNPGF